MIPSAIRFLSRRPVVAAVLGGTALTGTALAIRQHLTRASEGIASSAHPTPTPAPTRTLSEQHAHVPPTPSPLSVPVTPRPTRQSVRNEIATNTLTHVTRETNVSGIMQEGLQAHRGGTGGAGAALPDSPARRAFIEHSRNFVHLGSADPRVYGNDNPAVFYSNHYKRSGYVPRILRIAPTPATRAMMERDPDDQGPGRMRTRSDIPPQHIVHTPLESAFRAAGVVGADYAPEPFVTNATGAGGRSRTPTQQTEDIRRAVHDSEATIYTGE